MLRTPAAHSSRAVAPEVRAMSEGMKLFRLGWKISDTPWLAVCLSFCLRVSACLSVCAYLPVCLSVRPAGWAAFRGWSIGLPHCFMELLSLILNRSLMRQRLAITLSTENEEISI